MIKSVIDLEELKNIRRLIIKEYKRYIRKSIIAYILMAVVFISAFSASFVGWENNTAIWNQPPIAQLLIVVAMGTLLACVILVITTRNITFENQIFLKTFEAYEYISRYIKQGGSSSQDEDDLRKTSQLLSGISKRLLRRRGRTSLFELMKEANERYFDLGHAIHTCLIYKIKQENELSLIRDSILKLLDALAHTGLKRIESYIASTRGIESDGTYTEKSFMLKDRVRLIFIHVGRLFASLLLSILISWMAAFITSQQFSDFAGIIAISTTTIFATWEFRSRP